MSNIISNWRKQQESRHGNIKEGCEKLSQICGNDINTSRIGEAERGERVLPVCCHWLMLNECLPDLLKEAGFEYTGGKSSADWVELIDSLLLPKRVKK